MYNIRIFRKEQEQKKKMTDNQFTLLMLHAGMMQDGMSSDAAIALILMMEEPAEDVSWLIKKVKGKACT